MIIIEAKVNGNKLEMLNQLNLYGNFHFSYKLA
jgi:hypothetical protein